MRCHTTFGIGGPADLFVEVQSPEELGRCVRVLSREGIPWFILGGGANLLVGDRGIRGAVLHMGKMDAIRPLADSLWVDAGCSVDRVCLEFLARGLGGLENFFGMPGSIGGALYMNARCYEQDIAPSVRDILALSPQGNLASLSVDPALVPAISGQWAYKVSPFQPGGIYSGWIIVSARLAAQPSDGARLASVMRSRRLDRIAKGHYAYPSAGSMFKNDRRFGVPSGVLIDRLGLKGFRIGDAGVSEQHGNIFVNLGAATAADMRALIEFVQEKVLATHGFLLEHEVLLVGEF
ncbi:MAG: UDP-N-acetylmuramate dehydrogenase [Spirochaetes bacterium]|nr:MAG: UDP-N-acetylmuramate dehydrogenase [Spirochaetota bacterium]